MRNYRDLETREENTSRENKPHWEIEKRINIGSLLAIVTQALVAGFTILWMAFNFTAELKQHGKDIEGLQKETTMLHKQTEDAQQIISKMDFILNQLLEANRGIREDLKEMNHRAYRNLDTK
jgi:hypothetical protein